MTKPEGWRSIEKQKAGGGEGYRETERETERQRERQIHRQRDRDRGAEAERQRDRQRQTEIHTATEEYITETKAARVRKKPDVLGHLDCVFFSFPPPFLHLFPATCPATLQSSFVLIPAVSHAMRTSVHFLSFLPAPQFFTNTLIVSHRSRFICCSQNFHATRHSNNSIVTTFPLFHTLSARVYALLPFAPPHILQQHSCCSRFLFFSGSTAMHPPMTKARTIALPILRT